MTDGYLSGSAAATERCPTLTGRARSPQARAFAPELLYLPARFTAVCGLACQRSYDSVLQVFSLASANNPAAAVKCPVRFLEVPLPIGPGSTSHETPGLPHPIVSFQPLWERQVLCHPAHLGWGPSRDLVEVKNAEPVQTAFVTLADSADAL